MKALIAALFSVYVSLNCFANMAYMGPAPGQVSGVQLGADVRIVHELLTADLRNMPASNARVFANYRLHCSKKSNIRFVFVASSSDRVNLEVILNGSLVKPRLTQRPLGEESQLAVDDIGYGFMRNGEPIQDHLYSFEVWLNEGENILKIGYECVPTSFFQGDLAYWVFPYYLGNENTKKQYDSVFVNVLLPEGVQYKSNIEIDKKTSAGFISKNIAKNPNTHVRIILFNDIQRKIDITSLWLQILGCVLLLLLSIGVCMGYKRRLERNKKTWIYIVLYLIPGAILVSIFYFMALEYYYSYFDSHYGIWLRGSWGKGYYWLGLPFFCALVLAIWVVLILFYRLFIIKNK